MFVLTLGDCLEVMKGLKDKSVDCVLADLPYGCLSSSKNNTRERYIDGQPTGTMIEHETIGGCDWDVKIDLKEFWKQVKRLCKNDNTPVIMFCNTRFGIELINSNPSWFRYDLVWSKTNAVGFLRANKAPMTSHEMIYVFSKKGAYYNRIDITGDFPAGGGGRSLSNVYPSLNGLPNLGTTEAGRRCVKSVIEVANKKEKSGHPTAKPIELYEWLLSRYVREGGTVLDPTAGSFNSIYAARKLGFNAIGIEKDKNFFYKGVKRVMSA